MTKQLTLIVSCVAGLCLLPLFDLRGVNPWGSHSVEAEGAQLNFERPLVTERGTT